MCTQSKICHVSQTGGLDVSQTGGLDVSQTGGLDVSQTGGLFKSTYINLIELSTFSTFVYQY